MVQGEGAVATARGTGGSEKLRRRTLRTVLTIAPTPGYAAGGPHLDGPPHGAQLPSKNAL